MARGRKKAEKPRVKSDGVEVKDVACQTLKETKCSRGVTGRLTHKRALVSEKDRITQYFHPSISNYDTDKDSDSVVSIPSDSVVSCEVLQNEQLSNAVSTPHKIQHTANDHLSPSSALKQLHIEKKTVKSRRRLNPSQFGNQQVCVPKAACCPTQVSGNHHISEYFPVRRSERKTKRAVLQEEQHRVEAAILAECEDGLQVHNFEGKGRGIVTTRSFSKGEFVVEYAGELITMTEAKARERNYAQDQNTGCYMYYFHHRNTQYCVDATSESGRLGRLVNHSRNGNLVTKTVEIKNKPRLILIAREDINSGEEITYDYGDRNKESIRYHPWLLH